MLEQSLDTPYSYFSANGFTNPFMDTVVDSVQTVRSRNGDGVGFMINAAATYLNFAAISEGVWREMYRKTPLERASTLGFAKAVSHSGFALSLLSTGNEMREAMAADDELKPKLMKMQWRQKKIYKEIDEKLESAGRMNAAYDECVRAGN